MARKGGPELRVVIADGHGAYDVVTLIARIERRSDYCRTIDTSCGVFDAHGHPDSRPHGEAGAQARRIRWEWRRAQECATRLVPDR